MADRALFAAWTTESTSSMGMGTNLKKEMEVNTPTEEVRSTGAEVEVEVARWLYA
jgi:hypothetical protein